MRLRALGYGLVTDYVAVFVLVGIGGLLPAVSGFYALLAPARLAPFLAGTVAGGIAVRSPADRRTAARTGAVHAAAVAGVVLLCGAVAAVATTPAGPLLSLAVLPAGVVAWRRATTWRGRVVVAVGGLAGLVASLSGVLRTALAVVVEGTVLLPRMGAFAFLAPTRYGRGWTLLWAWVALTLFGGAIGGVLAARR